MLSVHLVIANLKWVCVDADAKLVHLTLDEFTIHEVTTALKRFLRTLNEPILTDSLYEKWISATSK